MKARVTDRPTRRRFLKKTAQTAAAVFGVPHLVPGSVFGAHAPSGRINLGFIGAGNQSRVDVPAFLRHDDVQVVAVCDVNTGSHGYSHPKHYLGREPVRKQVEAYYAAKAGLGKYRGCDAYNDFRQLLARDDVDAVAIVTPDHWHAAMTVMAAKAGKDIYCQKPMTLTIADGQEMIKAVRQYKRVFQTGSQYRSKRFVRFGCELVRNGRIGRLKKITTLVAKNNMVGPGPGWKPMPVPEGFGYDMWLGPAREVPYHKDRCLYRFRFIRDYSGGQTTNFGAHSNDIAQWGCGTDDTGPVEIEDLGAEWPPRGSLFNTATKVHFRARYANGVELTCLTKAPWMGTRFEGTQGWIDCGWKKLTTHPKSLKKSKIAPGELHLPRSSDHYRNFLDSVKSREDPISPVEIGHRTASLCHLGNIAMLLGRKVQWDPDREQFVNDDEANRMVSRPMRPPWHL